MNSCTKLTPEVEPFQHMTIEVIVHFLEVEVIKSVETCSQLGCVMQCAEISGTV